jgi:hypothetical protein
MPFLYYLRISLPIENERRTEFKKIFLKPLYPIYSGIFFHCEHACTQKVSQYYERQKKGASKEKKVFYSLTNIFVIIHPILKFLNICPTAPFKAVL